MRRLLTVALAVSTISACHSDPAKERAAEEREEREHEREKSEKAEREFRDKAKGQLGPADSDALYALGALLGKRVAPYAFGPEELAKVEKGFGDAARARKLQLATDDLEEWGPKVDAMLHKRASPALEAELEKGRKLLDIEAAQPGAERLPSGVVVRTLKAGEGRSPGPTDRVRVKYEGRVAGGTVFDQNASAELPIGQVIPCLTQGLQRLKTGGSAKLFCPPATAYGDLGRPPQIPGAATLMFDVELLAVLGK